jgi:SAM-dependent methyltransferase
MTVNPQIIGTPPWGDSPLGQYLLAWEQTMVDQLVADVFGFHALQVGWPSLDALRANRMPHRWLLNDGLETDEERVAFKLAGRAISIQSDFDALPFPANSLDLVVLPHTLEMSDDAHQTLREVERVLVPEGRVVVLGFNPLSLWGVGHVWNEALHRIGVASASDASPLPLDGELIGPRRLRDWLRLLSFEVERAHFGCYRPAVSTQVWLDRYARWDALGERWWPVLGAVYATVAVKRVRGMRLIGPARRSNLKRRAASAPAVATREGGLRSAAAATPGEGTAATGPDTL